MSECDSHWTSDKVKDLLRAIKLVLESPNHVLILHVVEEEGDCVLRLRVLLKLREDLNELASSECDNLLTLLII